LLDEGILLTRGESLQALNFIDTVVYDKTGTLTSGAPEIQDITVNAAREGITQAQALHLAAAIESSSAHPVARAFHAAELASSGGAAHDLSPRQVEVHAGQGIQAVIDGVRWRIGSARFAAPDAADQEAGGIWLGDDDGWVARFDLQDRLREGARSTVAELQKEGLASMILSGDDDATVGKVAGRVCIADWSARQSPQMKLERLERLRASGRSVLMIGDGVNDAPILAAADVSMTVKGGAELANSSADMILTEPSLSLVIRTRTTAQRARQLIRQNLSWAILYNISVLPLAVSGALKPWMAALGMSLSSLLVVANAARLVRERRAPAEGAVS
jgi:Cu2+-exporting ATPase